MCVCSWLPVCLIVIWGSKVTFQGWILSAAAWARQRAALWKPDWAGRIDWEEDSRGRRRREAVTSFPTFLSCWQVIPPPKFLSGWQLTTVQSHKRLQITANAQLESSIVLSPPSHMNRLEMIHRYMNKTEIWRLVPTGCRSPPRCWGRGLSGPWRCRLWSHSRGWWDRSSGHWPAREEWMSDSSLTRSKQSQSWSNKWTGT